MTPDKQAARPKGRFVTYAKRALWGLVGLVVVAAAVVTAMPKPVLVEKASVQQGELVISVDEDGKTRVKDRYVVSAPLSGNLTRIELRAGDPVKQGDVLGRIVPLRAPLLDARSKTQAEAQVAVAQAMTKQVAAQVERAQAALEFAKSEAARYRALQQENAISKQELDRALLEERARAAELTSSQFASKVAAHELSMARAALGHYTPHQDDGQTLTVTSPVAGRVLNVLHQSEGVVQAGAPLLELGDPAALEIVVDVLTSDAVNIKPGSPVAIEAWGGASLVAVVRTVEPSAFTRLSALGVEEQRVNAVIDLAEPYEVWQALGDGYRVEASIEVFRAKDVLKVPHGALFRSQGSFSLFVLEAGRARLRKVEVGRRNDLEAEITSGVALGDVVVVHPSDKVKDGVEVVLD